MRVVKTVRVGERAEVPIDAGHLDRRVVSTPIDGRCGEVVSADPVADQPAADARDDAPVVAVDGVGPGLELLYKVQGLPVAEVGLGFKLEHEHLLQRSGQAPVGDLSLDLGLDP